MNFKKTVNLPRELLEEAVKLSGSTTQTMAIILALQEYVRTKKIEKMQKMFGKGLVKFDAKHLKEYRSR